MKPANSTPQRPKAAIVYLARSTEKDLALLRRSLRLLDRHFNQRFDYPVLIFHEDFSPALQRSLQAMTRSRLLFPQVEFAFPDFVDRSRVPEFVFGRFGVGYRHMCRFFAGAFAFHPALAEFDWYMRLDTDSFLRGRVAEDPFQRMDASGADYGYITMLQERPEVVVGLWEAVCAYASANGLETPAFRGLATAAGTWNLRYYYNNFEICRLSFLRSGAHQRFFEYLDRQEGIYRHRWGDAPIRTMAVAMLLPPEKVLRFGDIPYSHAGFYTHDWHRQIDRIIGRLPAWLRDNPWLPLSMAVSIRFLPPTFP